LSTLLKAQIIAINQFIIICTKDNIYNHNHPSISMTLIKCNNSGYHIIYNSIFRGCGLGIGLYFLCVIGCYCWQIKGLKFERDVWQSQDRGEYSEVEVDYYLKRFETDRRQMWLWSFIGAVYVWAPVYLLIFGLSK